MSLLAAACTTLLYASSPSCVPEVSTSPFTGVAVVDPDLARVRGTGLLIVGLGSAQQAADVRAVEIASLGPRVSDTTREIVDNWNLDVGISLIAAAMVAVTQ